MKNQDEPGRVVDDVGLIDVVELTDADAGTGVREYAEGYLVSLGRRSTDIGAQRARQIYGADVAGRWVDDGLRWVVSALNEGGMNGTEVDLFDLLTWLAKHRPELLVACGLRVDPGPGPEPGLEPSRGGSS